MKIKGDNIGLLLIFTISLSSACTINSLDVNLGDDFLNKEVNISWTSNSCSFVDIEYSSDSGNNYNILKSNISSSDSVNNTFLWDTRNYNDGFNYTIRISNNLSNIISNNLTIDNSKPLTYSDFNFSGIWINNSFNLTLYEIDNISGINITYYCIDSNNSCNPQSNSEFYTGPIFISDEEISYFRFYSVDFVGNIQDLISLQIKIDTQSPITDISLDNKYIDTQTGEIYISPISNFTLNSQDYSGLLEDSVNFSDTNTTYYKIDNNSLQVYSSPFNLSGLSSGPHTIYFWSIDNAGNIESQNSIDIILDDSPPSAVQPTYEDPGQTGWYTDKNHNYSVNLSSCLDNDQYDVPSSTLYYKWSYELNFNSYNQSGILTIPINREGEYSLAYYCVDAVGNYDKSINFSLNFSDPDNNIPDLLIPGYDITSPVSNYSIKGNKVFDKTYSSDILINLSCIDNGSGCFNNNDSLIRFSLDGLADSPLTSDIIKISGEGYHTLKYKSVDLAGNEEEVNADGWLTLEFYIDKTNKPLTIIPSNILSSEEDINLTAILMPSLISFPITWYFEDNTTISSLSNETINKTFDKKSKNIINATITNGDEILSIISYIYIGSKPFFPQDTRTLEVDFNNLPSGSYSFEATEFNSSNFSISPLFDLKQYYEIKSNLTNGSFKVKLTFYYNDSNNDGIIDNSLILEDSLNVYYYENSSWILINGPSINKAQNTITVDLDHFTLFTVLGSSLFSQNQDPPGNSGGGGGGGGGSNNGNNNQGNNNLNNSQNNNRTDNDNNNEEDNISAPPSLNEENEEETPREGFWRRLFRNFFNRRDLTGAAVSIDENQDIGSAIRIISTIVLFVSLFYLLRKYEIRKSKTPLIRPIQGPSI